MKPSRSAEWQFAVLWFSAATGELGRIFVEHYRYSDQRVNDSLAVPIARVDYLIVSEQFARF
jgi:hypothetical protein